MRLRSPLVSLILLEESKSHYRSYVPDHTVDEGKVDLTNPAEAKREFASRRAVVDQWRQLSIIALSLTASIYIISIIDSWLFDGDYSKYRRNANQKRSTKGSKIGLQFSPLAGGQPPP